MNIVVWHEARLVTLSPEEDWGLIENGAIAVNDDRIEWVGPLEKLPAQYQSSQFICANHRTITPALTDCHTHLVYAQSRALEFEMRMKGASYETLHQQGLGLFSTVQATRNASFDALYSSTAARLRQLLVEGVTTIEIKSGYGLDFATERKLLRVAKTLALHFPVDIKTTFLGAHALPNEFKTSAEYIRYLLAEVLPPLLSEGLIDNMDAFCDHIAFTPGDLEPLFEFAQKNRLPIKVHAEQLSRSGGAQLAARYHALSADHLEFATQEDILALKQAGTVAVLLPGAYYYLEQKQKPPVELLRRHKVNMAIATDSNPGSSPTASLLLMLNMACVLFKLTPLEAVMGVTKFGAKALGLEKEKGCLAPGFKADFILWDIEHPVELAYRFGDNPCHKVIKSGKCVYDASNKV